MPDYLTIGEVSKITGVSSKSLRYYDEVGILKPAYVHPETGYRYYSPKQLKTLDYISACIMMGIPLKDLKNYMNENGDLQFSEVLLKGKENVLRQREMLNLILHAINNSLQHLENTPESNPGPDKYKRLVQQRYIVRFPYDGPMDFRSISVRLKKCVNQAYAAGIIPIIPTGFIYEYRDQILQTYIYFETLSRNLKHPWIAALPEGEYWCMQGPLQPILPPDKVFAELTAERDSWTIIATDLLSPSLSWDQFALEYQMLV